MTSQIIDIALERKTKDTDGLPMNTVQECLHKKNSLLLSMPAIHLSMLHGEKQEILV